MYKEQSVMLKIWENSVQTLLTIIKVASKTIVLISMLYRTLKTGVTVSVQLYVHKIEPFNSQKKD